MTSEDKTQSHNFLVHITTTFVAVDKQQEYFKSQFLNIQQCLKQRADDYIFLLEESQHGFHYKACLHMNKKCQTNVIKRFVESKLPTFSATVVPLKGSGAYENMSKEMKESKLKTDGPWTQDIGETKQHQTETKQQNNEAAVDIVFHKQAKILLDHMKKTDAESLNWIWPITTLDPKNDFIIHVQKLGIAVRIRYTNANEMLWNAFKKPVYH